MNYWFLYKKDTGEIYGAPYKGSAEEWTNIPDGCDVLGPFPEDTADDTIKDVEFNPSYYVVSNGQLTTVSNIADLQLSAAKSAKIAELDAAEAKELATFTSSALGTPHTYLTDDKSMTLLNGEYAFVNGPDYDNNPIPWYTVEEGYVNHTKTQFVQVYLDGRKAVQVTKVKHDTLIKQASAATTIDDVNAITW